MSDIAQKSRQLYDLMIKKGYPEDFAGLIASEMHTDFTATRMIGYIARSGRVPLEEVADEMLSILSDRERITQKHMLEHAQAKINEMYRNQSRESGED